jgi:PTH1 family peptidyl-tRNA hydrolase
MYVVVGLGNPGKKYENTKHNVGFVAMDILALDHSTKINKRRHRAKVGECTIGGEKVLLVKPQTFMNRSGESVISLVNYFKINPSNLIVIYDDVDIPLGHVRIRKSGSAGTHNGMRSIIKCLSSEGFPRVRIGVGADRGEIPLVDYVLAGFTKEQVPTIEASIVKAAAATAAIITEGIDLAMTHFNG